MDTPPFQTVAIIGRPDLGAHRAYFTKLANYLTRAGKTVFWETELAGMLRRKKTPFADIKRRADLVLVFGGDGTFLHAVRHLVGCKAYFIGSKLGGHLGFLTEHDHTQLEATLRKVFAGNFKHDERLLLTARVERAGTVVKSLTALNEVVINQPGLAQLMQLDLATEKCPITNLLADGVIIATPTGSTAYSLSAGGPIMYPSLSGFVITPINPHILANRPIVVPEDFTLHASTSHAAVILTADGQKTTRLKKGDVVHISQADWHVPVIHPAKRNYFALLRAKLHWSARE